MNTLGSSFMFLEFYSAAFFKVAGYMVMLLSNMLLPYRVIFDLLHHLDLWYLPK